MDSALKVPRTSLEPRPWGLVGRQMRFVSSAETMDTVRKAAAPCVRRTHTHAEGERERERKERDSGRHTRVAREGCCRLARIFVQELSSAGLATAPTNSAHMRLFFIIYEVGARFSFCHPHLAVELDEAEAVLEGLAERFANLRLGAGLRGPLQKSCVVVGGPQHGKSIAWTHTSAI